MSDDRHDVLPLGDEIVDLAAALGRNLAPDGRRVDARTLGKLAASGQARVIVRRRPRIAVIGDGVVGVVVRALAVETGALAVGASDRPDLVVTLGARATGGAAAIGVALPGDVDGAVRAFDASVGPILRALVGGRAPGRVGFVGSSGAGKTTLVCRLVERMSRDGLRVGAVKHDAHRFQMDREGKDTWRFRQAGARAIAIASTSERAVVASTGQAPSLAELCATLPDDLDVILVEGYRAEGIPKIEVRRRGVPDLAAHIDGVVAIASDDPGDGADAIPRFALDDIDDIDACVRALARR